jgi:hypothetical protein
MLIALSLQDDWLRTEISGKRSRPVEVVSANDGKSGAVVWFIDYSGGRSIGIEIVGSTVVGRLVGPIGVPNISPPERDIAETVALHDPGVNERAPGGLLTVNNITSSTGPSCRASRCLAVFLTARGAGDPSRVVAIVDLRREAVIELLP